jgi:hypothetical protein
MISEQLDIGKFLSLLPCVLVLLCFCINSGVIWTKHGHVYSDKSSSVYIKIFEKHSLPYNVGKFTNCGALRVLLQEEVDVWKLHVDSV